MTGTGSQAHGAFQLPGAQRDHGNWKAVAPVVATEFNLYGVIMELAEVASDDVLLDIGCGHGELLVHAARRCHCRCIGLDIRTSCLTATRHAAEAAGVAHLVQAVEHDMMGSFASLSCWSEASVIYAYLLPHLILHLEPLLRQAVEDGKVCNCSSSHRNFFSTPPSPQRL